MRRGIMVLFIVIIIVNILSGCDKSPNVDLGLSEERFVYSCRMNGELIRYDVVDKKAVIACPDPLCKHEKDCPVSNIYTAYVSDNYIMYGKHSDGILSGYIIFCYDLKAGTITKVLDCPRYQQITFIRDFAYFSASHVEYNSDGSPKGEVWDVYRYTMNSNELIKLNDEGLISELLVQDYSDTQIVWFDFEESSGSNYFTTDYNFKNKSTLNYKSIIGNYVYDFKTNYSSEDSYIIDIKRSEITTGESENVITEAISYRLDNIKDPKGVVYTTHHNDDGKSIYYTTLSDLKTKKIGTVPEGYSLTGDGVFPNIGATLYLSGYIGIYVKKEDADHSEEHNSNTMLFININSDDSFILTP